MNQNNVENSIKVGHSKFDIVAVPQTNISPILDTTTNTKPVNVKIRIRNKGEMTEGLISFPKLTTTGPKKVRLVSSDQTIISFDIFMETDSEKKVRKKPNYTFFNLFKPNGCFNNQNDDDIYPYIPSSSNEAYRAKSASNVNDLQDDKIYDKKFALRKSLSPPITSSNFLGKCKPGGCLDPPFGEDKYIYKPKNKMLAIDQKNIENRELDEKCVEDTKNTDEVTNKLEIVLHDSPSKTSIKETYSHSLITYPPVLFSSDISEENQNKKPKPRNSTENKVRISINEFSDTYFMPPKKQKNRNEENVSIEFLETPNRYGSYDKTVVDSFNQKESLPLPKNEPFNQATEEKLFSTQCLNNSSQRITETNLSKDGNLTVGVSESNNNTNIKIQISKSKSEVSDVSAAELVDDTVENKIKVLENLQTDIVTFQGTKNHIAETKTETKLFETNLDSTVVTTPSMIYKGTIIIQDATTTAKDSRISKIRSKSTIDELKLMSNNLVDNILQTSQDRNKSCIDKQSIESNFFVSTDENEIKFADFIHSDKITLKSSNATEVESSAVIDNPRLISLTESVNHSYDKLNQTKESDASKISVKEEMHVKKITNMHQKYFQQNKQLQDVISTTIINNEKESDTIDIISVQKYPIKTEDKKYGDQDFTTTELSAEVQMTNHKSIRISNEAKDAVMDFISAEPIESDKVSNALSNDLKTGSFIISDNIHINNEKSTPALKEKISLPLQLRQKDNSNNIYDEYKGFSTIQNVEQTSSLNLSTSLTLPEKTSSYYKRYPIKKDSVKYDTKNSSANDQILISPSLLDLSGKAAETSDNLEVQGPTNTADDLIPIRNVPVEIQSSQNIEIDGHRDLPTKDHLTEKEASDDRGTSGTKTELQIKNSKVTLGSDYKTSAPTDYLEVHKSIDIVHGLIPIHNDPLEIQSLQNIDIKNLHDLSTKDYFTEKESDTKETLETKTELQINNSSVTILSDYKTSATPTDWKVHGPDDNKLGFIPITNVPVKFQNLQNIGIEDRHAIPNKDHLTEKEVPDYRATSETKTELQIKNSKATLVSDYKTSATPTEYLDVHRSGDIVHGVVPVHNAPLEIQSFQNIDIKNLHDLPTKAHFTEKKSHEKETLETKTELQINNISVTILSDDKMSATPTDWKVHGPGDSKFDFIPISNVPVEFQNLQNIGIEDRHDLLTKDHFTEKEEPDRNGPLNTKTELQNNDNRVAILSDYNTSSDYVHDTLDIIASINKKIESRSKVSKADFYNKPLDFYIPKVLPAQSKEPLKNDDEINSTKTKEKNLILNENSSIEINLGFYSFVNNKNETLIRTFDTSKDLRIDTQDKNITIIKSIIRKNDSEIRIPVNSEMDLTLQIKKAFDKGHISKRKIDNIKKESLNKVSEYTKYNKDILLHETLHSVYENLVPVENILHNLKKETDFLTKQQVLFRDILSTMKTTSQRIINKNKSCTCNK